MVFATNSCEEALLPTESNSVKLESGEKIRVKETKSKIPDHEKTIPPDEYQIRHPLRGVKLIDGKVPGIDIHDNPITKKRFAIGEITTSEGGKPMKTISGIIELDRSKFVPQPKDGKVNVNSLSSSLFRPKIGKTLQQEAKEGGLLNVAIRVVADETIENVWHQLQRGIGLGNIQTKADLVTAREVIMENRRTVLKVNKAPIVKKLTALGIKFRVLENLNLINAQIPADDLKKLELIAEVRSMRTLNRESSNELDEACPMPSSWLNNAISGTEILQGTQIKQFLCENYDAQPSSGAYGVAMIETAVSYCSYGQYDWRNGPTRWKDAQECGLFTCDSVAHCSNGSDANGHATKTTSVIAGDLTQEQSPTYSTDGVHDRLQAERSGYAPEAEVYRYAMGNFGFGSAVNHLLGRSDPPLATNISWGTNTGFPGHDCIGDWNADESVNAMYESGIFVVKSAGNEGGSGPDCTVSIPGSALGSFTVAGHGNNFFGSITDVRFGSRYLLTPNSGSSYGRNDAGRDVIDISAPAYRRYLPSGYLPWLPNQPESWNRVEHGTSISAPTVTAAALDFADFYQSTYSSWILNPGALFSSMLLMGDRQTTNGKAITDFDPVWGGKNAHANVQ